LTSAAACPAKEMRLSGNSLTGFELTRGRTSRISLRVKPDLTLLVRAPRLTPASVIDRFVKTKAQWISQQRRKHSQLYDFALNPIHPNIPISYRYGPLKAVSIGGDISLSLPTGSEYWPGYLAARTLIKTSLLKLAQDQLPLRLNALATEFKLDQPREIQIKFMRSRWGSCTAAGTISLNSQLVRLPLGLIDYVICHELTHLVAANHGAGFHHQLESIMPDAASRRRQLRRWHLYY